MYDSSPPEWETPIPHPALSGGEIHLWACALDAGPCEPQWLNAAELRRLDGLANTGPRQSFCRSRSRVRQLLGAYLDCPPAQVDIGLDAHGKPHLKRGSPLEFNLSHAGNWLLLAVARRLTVGVDVEIPRPLCQARAIARRLFSPDAIQSLARENFSTQAFFACWTRHEARQKCLGQGIFGQRAPEADFPCRTFRLPDGALASLSWHGAATAPRLRFFDLSRR